MSVSSPGTPCVGRLGFAKGRNTSTGDFNTLMRATQTALRNL
jgi:hypothetical protein